MAKKNVPKWRPTKEQKKAITEVREDFLLAYEQRNKTYRHMRYMSPEEFWFDCRDRYDSLESALDANADEDWESNAYRPKTRNKTIATAASLLSSGVGVDISAQDSTDATDRAMSEVTEDIYEWSLDREDFDMKVVMAVIEKRITGTVHLMEDIVWDKRTVKEIKSIDFDDGSFDFDEVERTDFKGCRAELVSNEEMYPGDIWEPSVQAQPFYVRRKITNYGSAESAFGKYDNWKYVQPGAMWFLSSEADDRKEDEDVDDDRVEIIWYWDRPKDRYRLVINGILLNGAEEGFPYPHKMYPIAKGIGTPFSDTRFYYGNSDPNMLRDEQDLDNDLWRMYIDSIKLKVKPPLGVSNTELANRDLVVPGVMYPLGTDDRVEAMKEVTAGVGQAEFKLLEMTETQMDESTVDPLLSGQQAQGDPTATEVRAVVGSAERLRGFAQMFLGDLLVQHAHLRIPNQLWFLTHDDEYQRVVKDKIRLSTGEDGRKVIEFSDSIDIPSPRDILASEAESERMGKPEERIYVDKDAVQDYRYRVQVSASPKPRRGGATKILREIEKYRQYLQNPMFNQKWNAENLAEAFGDDPKDAVNQEQEMPMMPQQQQQQGAGQAQEMAKQEMI
jgi:hypothetical protein